ncbi:MAG: hypothetical protein HY706_21180 [Candidatus Hydrogenedentes bacterium]|nr:hypothetical protein [Candidatus Hydrogenedentota bacterium]
MGRMLKALPSIMIVASSWVYCTACWAVNGAQGFLDFGAKAPNGTEYWIRKYYLVYDQIPVLGSPACESWPVKTCQGNPVAYSVLADSDFTAQQQEDINRLTETAPSGPPEQWRMSAPSARYDCYAYMVGRTDVWLYDPKPFIAACYDTAQPYPWDPDIAGHGRKRVFEFDYQHGSRIEFESYFAWFVGKWGGAGVYKSTETELEAMYGYPDTEFYDRCP